MNRYTAQLQCKPKKKKICTNKYWIVVWTTYIIYVHYLFSQIINDRP